MSNDTHDEQTKEPEHPRTLVSHTDLSGLSSSGTSSDPHSEHPPLSNRTQYGHVDPNAEEGSDEDGDTFHDAEGLQSDGSKSSEENGVDSRSSTVGSENRQTSEKSAADVDTISTESTREPQQSIAGHEGMRMQVSSSLPRDTDPAPAVNPPSYSEATSQMNRPEASGDADFKGTDDKRLSSSFPTIKRQKKLSGEQPQISEWSHQQLTQRKDDSESEEEVEWQAMPAIDEYDVYDDNGRLVARGAKDDEEEDANPYARAAGMSKGYTRVLLDEDAKSATSLDDDTDYLFKKPKEIKGTIDEEDEDEEEEEQRDVLSQLQTTKELLTEGQRIAYVGVVRLTIFKMLRALEGIERSKSLKKDVLRALESMELWGQQTMVRLYKHMEISNAEQLMIEQLAEHGLEPADLVPPLMQNAKVKNPMVEDNAVSSTPDPSSSQTSLAQTSTTAESTIKEIGDGGEVPEVHGVEDMPQTKQIDLDIRWTVLCDLFLVLISDSVYDARSRRLLERVASAIKINWAQICRFEKRVVDQLEMEEAAKEDWDESDHIEERRKKGLKKKYMYMGMATVGGGLVIGLSAGLLAPVIGAGLAAGFTTIGVTGTAGFLGGIGGAALITSAATAAGGTIAIRASNRRTGHVKTFEYRPLHNNKRLNLILTISGWMTGKVDDVRLPFSTVDPIMGDIYSLFWEPEMLQSMGDTINILATEALTQTVQQVLGSTILVALMASLQLPIVLTKLSYLIDNPWTVSLDRANAAGLILADSLMARHLGQRPITLVGFSLGARVIFACLKELASRGAYGVIQNVYMFGSPVVAKKDEWLRARSVIAGRFVNGYASNDWILGYLFRATSGGIMRVAGLAPVEDVPGLENLDVTDTVNGHMAYRTAIPKLLRKLGWEVESDEFSEIEDPDPEDHARRQRELIREIDEARKKQEIKPERRFLGFWKKAKPSEKKEWEKYNAAALGQKSPKPESGEFDSFEHNTNILFDIDAIRKELISEQIEIRELDSTQPPMQFSSVKDGQKHIEYLRLPPEIKPDEVAKMKLPPRPDEIDDGPLPPLMRSGLQRTASTPNPAQKVAEKTPKFEEYDLDQPKELTSTLPPLRLTPQINSSIPGERPEHQKHDPEPETASIKGLAITSPVSPLASPELGHNAWAEEQNEVKMTFE